MEPEIERGLEPGQVYIKKGDSQPEAVIIHQVDNDGSFYTRHTSCMNTHKQFRPVKTPGWTQEEFLKEYELATPEKLKDIMIGLEDEKKVISEKLGLLKSYCNTFHS